MPEYINDNESAEQYFDFSLRSEVPVELGLSPGFELKVIEETDKYRIIIDEDGVKEKVFKDGTSTIPHYLEFPLKGRKEWEELFKPLKITFIIWMSNARPLASQSLKNLNPDQKYRR